MTESTAIATRQPTAFELELANHDHSFQAALPEHIPIERFKRVIITAINQTPDLAKADRRSLFTACIKAAQDGLLPDGREAALVLFGNAVAYMPMVFGIRKRLRNSGEVLSAEAHVVYENDEFSYELGDNPSLVHKPTLQDRGKPVGAYAVIKLKNGEILREVMNLDQIEKVRSVSKSKDGPAWKNWYDEMMRKVVLRRCAKAAPSATDVEALWDRHEEDDQRVVAAEIPPRPERVAIQAQVEEVVTDEKPIAQEPYTIISSDGQEQSFALPADASSTFANWLEAAAKRGVKDVDGLWESNGLIMTQFRERGEDKRADELKDLYAALAAKLRAPEKKSEPAKPGPSSPLKDKKVQWGTWVTWAMGEIQRTYPGHEAFMAQHKPEFDFINENRTSDADNIQRLIESLNE